MSGGPEYTLDVDRWLDNPVTKRLRFGERGLLIQLICLAIRHGSLPAAEADLARMVGLRPERFANLYPRVAPFFISTNGSLSYPDADAQKTHREMLRERRANAAKARWHKDQVPALHKPKHAMHKHADANADALHEHCMNSGPAPEPDPELVALADEYAAARAKATGLRLTAPAKKAFVAVMGNIRRQGASAAEIRSVISWLGGKGAGSWQYGLDSLPRGFQHALIRNFPGYLRAAKEDRPYFCANGASRPTRQEVPMDYWAKRIEKQETGETGEDLFPDTKDEEEEP